MQPAVYLLASARNGPVYTGVTRDLVQQVWQHRMQGGGPRLLVYYELHASMDRAIVRQQRIQDWHPRWQLRLIEERNPGWIDLWEEILAGPESRPAAP